MTLSADHTSQSRVEDDRTGLSVEAMRRAMADHLRFTQGRRIAMATLNDFYIALAQTVRDRLMPQWLGTFELYLKPETRIVSYLSAEFLVGPHLANNLISLGLQDSVKQAVEESGLSLADLIAHEEEPGLGNGGLGRLAACYMDSLSTLQIPAIGYGIRYEFGIFDQAIQNGWQVELTDKWLQNGNPWEIARPESSVTVGLGGYTETYTNSKGDFRVRWVPDRIVKGIPYDTPILGYQVSTANTLRLWKAEAPESFDFYAFNTGDYYGAVDAKVTSENITKVLYPNDEMVQGKQLRLEQQYFFVSCALQDMLRIHLASGRPITEFHEKFAVQLNDTHPAIGVAELMRLLVDRQHLDWDTAWYITQRTFAFTNHTLLPEALEKWSVDLFGQMLPRHLEIIYEINQRFLDEIRIQDMSEARLSHFSLIGEDGEKTVRMAHLACVGSHHINGVAELHTKLMKQDVFKDFYGLWPHKFTSVTNGVTPRRWVVSSNPQLTELISDKIGRDWIHDLDQLRQLEPYADDPEFRQRWRQVKQSVKQELATFIYTTTKLSVNPESLFDVHMKRIHQYKRQHLKVLHIIALYNRIKQDPNFDVLPRTFLFAGKAAPGYREAKLMIKLITSVADVVNRDPAVGDRLKVVFIPNYNVTNSQRLYPAADLSEQISTAGKEASGTGNMKFALNGALTVGTLDGANVEIRSAVGEENFFLFGLNADEVYRTKAEGYNPRYYYDTNHELQQVMHLIQDGVFSHGDRDLFKPMVERLLNYDPYMLMADFQSYIDCQAKVDEAYRNPEHWTRMSILNSARMGYFSSDRSIQDYCDKIWKVQPVPVELEPYDSEQAVLKVDDYFSAHPQSTV
ncbi:MAG: glycogen/starch/alpha-glucan phosphorylase [Elainellaceae cyanobacterium]